MHLCYIDESGDSQPIKTGTDNIQPLLVVVGVMMPADNVKALTYEFIRLKQTFYPNKFANRLFLDVLTKEIKGTDIRSDIRQKPIGSKAVQHHFRFLDGALAILKQYDARILGRIWIKRFGIPLLDQSIYTMSTQQILRRFQCYLETQDSTGFVIADFRDPQRNSYVAHSIFTQKYKAGGNNDAYPSVHETATFAISDNHAGLQLADLIASAILYPMAARTLCHPAINNPHTHAQYEAIAQRYKKRIRALVFNGSNGPLPLLGMTASPNPHSAKTINDVLN